MHTEIETHKFDRLIKGMDTSTDIVDGTRPLISSSSGVTTSSSIYFEWNENGEYQFVFILKCLYSYAFNNISNVQSIPSGKISESIYTIQSYCTQFAPSYRIIGSSIQLIYYPLDHAISNQYNMPTLFLWSVSDVLKTPIGINVSLIHYYKHNRIYLLSLHQYFTNIHFVKIILMIYQIYRYITLRIFLLLDIQYVIVVL